MNKRKYITLLILIALPFAAIIFFCARDIQEPKIDNAPKICLENKCFDIEIARTEEEKRTGLMNREHLDSDMGMLFLFENEGVYDFWMKNTLIPLDIIWIGENKEVVFIKENAMLCKLENCETFHSTQKAKYVLEINGGLAEKYGIKAGDKTDF